VAVALGFKNEEGEMSRKVVKMKESCVGRFSCVRVSRRGRIFTPREEETTYHGTPPLEI
jgi:hypothetical protein